MDTGSPRWRQVEQLFGAARECDAEARKALLARAEPDIRREVESLLAQAQSSTVPGDAPVGLKLDPLGDARFAPGHIFAARYRIVSLAGRGAMGEVYRADDLRLGQTVALKLMSESIARRDDGLQRLTDEVRLARGISHPNVCRLYDIGYAEGWHFLSMEYVEGETLSSLLRRIGELAASKAFEAARQLCAGLAAAHARGVVHRDLKPSNIMMDERGRIRIMDFGLAVAVSNNVREVAGTPAYMSPEQRAGAPVTVRSDLYALGRVLEEILPADVDLRVSAIVQRCLAIDPSNRPTSAYEVAAGLPDAGAHGLSDFDIPSPAMVAATPTAGAVAPATAWLLLATIVGGSLAIARAGGTSILPSQLPKPPEVLAERARQILSDTAQLGAPAADRAFWWWSSEADNRVRFTYRDGSTFLIPANLFRSVSANDPAPDPTRMRMVTLEADGTLSTGTPTPRTVWSRPPGGVAGGELLYWVLMLIAFVASCVLARRNLRGREGDRRGAWRLSVTVGFGALVFAALRAHHVPSAVDELAWLLGATGWAGFWGAFSWLAYVGFEPYGRRWWPSSLISWTRVLEGRFLDPLVGRHVLVGLCVGAMWTALTMVYSHVAHRSAPPVVVQAALEALRSSGAFGSVVVAAVLNAVVTSLCTLAVLVSFRLIFRSTWLASVALTVLAIPAFANGTSGLDIGLAAVLVTVNLVVLLKLGVVAQMALLLVTFLMWLPLTLDPSAWYFGQSLSLLLLITGLGMYGFVGALGGRPAFGLMEPT